MTRRHAIQTLSIPSLLATPAMAAGASLVFVGTYTRDDSRGIYVFSFDPVSGKFGAPELAAEVANPSFLALHPQGRFLYAVGELAEFQGQKSGAVHAFAIDAASRRLRLLNSVPSGGSGPCHLVVDKTGRNVLVAHYGSGSAAVVRIEPDGKLGERSALVQHQGSSANAQRQSGPHAHSVNLSQNNRWAVVADLGTDEYIVYAFDASKGSLARSSAAKPKAGSGPRHFSFHPSYRYGYGVNELTSSVTAFSWDEGRGQLTEIETVSTLPAGFRGDNSCAEILVHPKGGFLYASNRGHNSIAGFAIDSTSGRLTPLGHTSTQGEVPRNFRIDPSGAWLLAANQNSANVVGFEIDRATGRLAPSGQSVKVFFPVCLKFV